jgi:hypothetical protein
MSTCVWCTIPARSLGCHYPCRPMHLGRQAGWHHVLESRYVNSFHGALFVKNMFQKGQNDKITLSASHRCYALPFWFAMPVMPPCFTGEKISWYHSSQITAPKIWIQSVPSSGKRLARHAPHTEQRTHHSRLKRRGHQHKILILEVIHNVDVTPPRRTQQIGPQYQPAHSSLSPTWEGPGNPTIPLEGFHFSDKHGQHHHLGGWEHSLPSEVKAQPTHTWQHIIEYGDPSHHCL